MSISPYVKWLSGSLCYNNASCKYWTWIEDYNGWDQTCHLKDANPGLTYLEGVISGGKNCMAPTGKDSEPYQHFFFHFQIKQDPLQTCPQCYCIAFYMYSYL